MGQSRWKRGRDSAARKGWRKERAREKERESESERARERARESERERAGRRPNEQRAGKGAPSMQGMRRNSRAFVPYLVCQGLRVKERKEKESIGIGII